MSPAISADCLMSSDHEIAPVKHIDASTSSASIVTCSVWFTPQVYSLHTRCSSVVHYSQFLQEIFEGHGKCKLMEVDGSCSNHLRFDEKIYSRKQCYSVQPTDKAKLRAVWRLNSELLYGKSNIYYAATTVACPLLRRSKSLTYHNC